MIINGNEVTLNMLDADTYEKYMEAAVKVDAALDETISEEEAKDYKKVAGMLKRKCNGIKKFCDELFGEGMGEKLCGQGHDFKHCYFQVYNVIIEDVLAQGREMKELRHPDQNVSADAT